MVLSIGSLTLMHTAYVDDMPITRSKTIMNFWKAISVMDLGHCNLLNYKEKNYLKLHNKWGSLCLPIFPVITLQLSRAGLEKVLISPWLVTLLHICGVIPTPQSPILPVTPRNRQRRCPKRRRLHIERRRLRIEHRYRRIEWRLFHDVSQCFKCFMMFY